MNKKGREVLRTIGGCVMAVMIPGLLVAAGIQSFRYANLEKEIKGLEEKQVELIEQNKKLITEISILSSTDRIEDIAQNELEMRKAETEEIVRVEMAGKNK